MVPLSSLWLPDSGCLGVLASLASSVIHMVLPIHKNRVGRKSRTKMPRRMLFRRLGITPGDYTVPCGGLVQRR